MCLHVWSGCRYTGSLSKQHSRCLRHLGRVFILCRSLICSGSEPFRPEEQLLSTEGEIFLLTTIKPKSIHLIEPSYAQQSWFTLKQGILGLSLQPSSHAVSWLNLVLEKLSGLSLVKVDLPKDGPLCLKSKCYWIVKIS